MLEVALNLVMLIVTLVSAVDPNLQIPIDVLNSPTAKPIPGSTRQVVSRKTMFKAAMKPIYSFFIKRNTVWQSRRMAVLLTHPKTPHNQPRLHHLLHSIMEPAQQTSIKRARLNSTTSVLAATPKMIDG